MKDHCTICHKFRERYTRYPHNICIFCCPKLPVSTILTIMDITYHEAISSSRDCKLPSNLIDLDYEHPRFWITTDENDKFIRCGTGKFIQQDHEINITIMESYISNELGIRDMKKIKQNFKRIRAGKPYARY